MKSYYNSCRDKFRFDSREKADAAIHNDGKAKPDRMESYFCNCCQKWHVGHNNKRKAEYKKTLLHAEIRVTYSKDKKENGN